jgi:hypothetical protein
MTQYELEQLWIKGSLTEVSYTFGDKVRMKSGERAGEVGRIVAQLAIDPAPDYVIEFSDGASENATQPEIERAA